MVCFVSHCQLGDDLLQYHGCRGLEIEFWAFRGRTTDTEVSQVTAYMEMLLSDVSELCP